MVTRKRQQAPESAIDADTIQSLSELDAKRKKIERRSEPLRAERDTLVASIQPILAKIAALDHQIIAIEQPHLGRLDNEIAFLSRALRGGRSLSTALAP